MVRSHKKFHSSNAFCGDARPYESEHLQDLIGELSDDELKQLVTGVGIKFDVTGEIPREEYENVIDEADREYFYKEYKNILNLRKKK